MFESKNQSTLVPRWFILYAPFLLAIFVSLLLPSPSLARQHNDLGTKQDGELAKIQKKYNLKIVSKDPQFPVATAYGKIEGRSANPLDLEKYVPLFVNEFSLYPVELVERCRLKRIVLCDELQFAGQRRTAIPDNEHDTLYLDIRRGNHRKHYQQAVIHHEFFHIIDYRDDGSVYRDPVWAALNSSDFSYGTGGRTVQGSSTTSKLTEKYPGFLNHYSTTGVEEDKAELFAHLIIDYQYVKQRSNSDPVLDAKVKRIGELLVDFCPKMNEQFWNRVQKTKRSPTPNVSSDDDPEHQHALEDLMLFFPSKFPDGNWKPKNLIYEEVWFTSDDGTRIHAWYCPCKNPRAVVLYAHGNAGNLSHRASIMSTLQNQLNVSSLFFDYRGYGRSEGRPTTSGVVSDARAAAAFLAKHANVKPSELILMGRSLGGAVVVEIAGEIKPRGLVVESTFPSLKRIAKHHYPKLAWLVHRNKLDSKTKIQEFKGSLLQSHGTHDFTIPIALGEELFQAANEPKQFLKLTNADHNDEQPHSYYEQLSSFVDSLNQSGK